MGTETGEELKQCLALLTKIREEYPEGDFDREMLHGDMDFRFRQIKENREKLGTFPPVVCEFARFLDSLAAPEESIKAFLQSMIEKEERFGAMVTVGFKERQQKLEQWSLELGTAAKHFNELLTRSRLSAILDPGYKLNERYREVISAYLNL